VAKCGLRFGSGEIIFPSIRGQDWAARRESGKDYAGLGAKARQARVMAKEQQGGQAKGRSGAKAGCEPHQPLAPSDLTWQSGGSTQPTVQHTRQNATLLQYNVLQSCSVGVIRALDTLCSGSTSV